MDTGLTVLVIVAVLVGAGLVYAILLFFKKLIDKELGLELLDELRMPETITIAEQDQILRKHESKLEQKFAKNGTEKIYQKWPLTLQVAELPDGGVRIAWMMDAPDRYELLGFRRDGGYSHDPYDEDQNGIQFVHSADSFNYTVDRPGVSKTLYYTFFLQHAEAHRGAKARRELLGKTEKTKEDKPKPARTKEEKEDEALEAFLISASVLYAKPKVVRLEKLLHMGWLRFTVNLG